jgi:hypothetical protein
MAMTLFAEKNRVNWMGVRPGVYGEKIAKDGTQLGVGSTILYTVPADRTLLLFNSWSVSLMTSTVGLDHVMAIFNAVPAVEYRLFHSSNLAATATIAISQARTIPYELPEGYSVQIIVAGGAAMLGGFEGILVDPLVSV